MSGGEQGEELSFAEGIQLERQIPTLGVPVRAWALCQPWLVKAQDAGQMQSPRRWPDVMPALRRCRMPGEKEEGGWYPE